MSRAIRHWLYVILDRKTLRGRNFLRTAKKIIGARPDMVQLRDKSGFSRDILKTARILKPVCEKNKVKLIINDRLDLALLAGCHGVHLGQDDVPVGLARRLLGRNKIIGVSCHSLGQALKAQKSGADYISIGPVFSTVTKPEYRAVGLRLVSLAGKKSRLPFFAIGDVNTANLKRVLRAGAKNICVCRQVCLAKDPASMVKRLKSFIKDCN